MRIFRDPMFSRSLVALSIAGMVLISGCTGVEPALVGAAVTGVGTGISATRWGKLNLAFHASAPEVTHAVTRAVDELGLSLIEDRGNDRRRVYELRDDRKNTITIVVEQRGGMATLTQVNVGWFGSNALAQLLGKRIAVQLFGEELDHRRGVE